MDLREKKTKRSIAAAFLRLRKTKALERITVKELAQLAEISKATFYLHYRDIFDLSDALQEEVIQKILSGLPHPETFLSDRTAFTFALMQGFYAQQNLIDTLFSGNQAAALPLRIEKEMRSFVHTLLPGTDPKLDMLLTYQIQGSYFVYQQYHRQYGIDEIIRFVGSLADVMAEAVPLPSPVHDKKER